MSEEIVEEVATDADLELNIPNLEFIKKTSDDDSEKKFLNLCVPLHKFALKGDWAAAKLIIDKEKKLKNAAIAFGRYTLLHIAVGANQIEFVKQLLKMLDDKDLELKNIKGQTAFIFAAEAGNIEMADLMLEKNKELPTIRDRNGSTPIQYSVSEGKYKMTWYLYCKTIHCFKEKDWNGLFLDCVYTGIYDLALEMAKKKKELVFACNETNGSALHFLARHELSLGSFDRIKPDKKIHAGLELVKFLWTTIIEKHCFSEPEIMKVTNEPYQLIMEAAKIGNFAFLSEVISAFPGFIGFVDSNNQSIIHMAVAHRHASIFNLVHHIGPMKNKILSSHNKEKNTLLHLVAQLAPQDRLELVSGAAFQMSLELVWFEKVKMIMVPALIKMKNKKGKTAQEIFSKEHKDLRKNGEEWMKKTAESCMLISTVIATGVFSAALSLPGGTDDTGKPNSLSKTSFLVFTISDALALISSSTAILIFLSILVSRYREYDFYKSLPLKLIFGLIALFISITSMMVAFSSAFFIIYLHGSIWVPTSIAILSSLPILLYMCLQFSLFADIIRSSFNWRRLSKSGKNLIN